MATVYPHLTMIADALAIDLAIPVLPYVSLETVTNQAMPAVYLIPDTSSIKQSIQGNGSIKSLRFGQGWSIYVAVQVPSDQRSGIAVLELLGEWQAKVLQALCKPILESGGPIQIIECAQPKVYDGGIAVGQILLSDEFVFNSL